ncbi:hypothetical protein ACNFHO_04355, partial [Pseudomonas sp. NY15374]
MKHLEPDDADPAEVAREIVRVVGLPLGKRPFRVHVEPSQDGAEVVNAVADRARREMDYAIDLQDLLSPAVIGELPVVIARLRDRRRIGAAGGGVEHRPRARQNTHAPPRPPRGGG